MFVPSLSWQNDRFSIKWRKKDASFSYLPQSHAIKLKTNLFHRARISCMKTLCLNDCLATFVPSLSWQYRGGYVCPEPVLAIRGVFRCNAAPARPCRVGRQSVTWTSPQYSPPVQVQETLFPFPNRFLPFDTFVPSLSWQSIVSIFQTSENDSRFSTPRILCDGPMSAGA